MFSFRSFTLQEQMMALLVLVQRILKQNSLLEKIQSFRVNPDKASRLKMQHDRKQYSVWLDWIRCWNPFILCKLIDYTKKTYCIKEIQKIFPNIKLIKMFKHIYRIRRMCRKQRLHLRWNRFGMYFFRWRTFIFWKISVWWSSVW